MTVCNLPDAVSRSISPENLLAAPGSGGGAVEGTGAPSARELGRGWKVSPSVRIAAGETFELATIDGSGVITHLWLTVRPQHWRTSILRVFWDGSDHPAVEVPLGDFFCVGWGSYVAVNSLQIAVNPHGGLNSYWPMPFRTGARLTLENLSSETATVYYQVDFELRDVGPDAGYLHARWQRSNPLARGEVHELVDLSDVRGHYAGTYLAWQSNSSGWWGEGEFKFYLDGDDELPTICGTGTEDYFGGAWNFDVPGQGYTAFSTPYLGLPQVTGPDGLYESQQRFGMYRWHVLDPIRFTEGIRVTVQALGWRSDRRYLQLQDDIASTSILYLDDPGGRDQLVFTEAIVEVV